MLHRLLHPLFLSFSLFASLFCPRLAVSELPAAPLFKLDSEWKLAQISNKGQRGVRAVFIRQSDGPRGLSAVVATETSELSLDAYGKAVKKLIQESPKSDWRKLGSLKVGSDKGLLAEVDQPSPYGPLTMLQLITKRDQTFFILTVAAGKEEFIEKRSELMQIVRSFELVKNPLEWLEPSQSALLLGLFEGLSKSAEKRLIAEKTSPTAQPYNPENAAHAASAPLKKESPSDIEPCASVLLDQLDQVSIEHKTREMISAFFASEKFQKELWPKFGGVIHKHFGHLGPAWELETLAFIQHAFIKLPAKALKK